MHCLLRGDLGGIVHVMNLTPRPHPWLKIAWYGIKAGIVVRNIASGLQPRGQCDDHCTTCCTAACPFISWRLSIVLSMLSQGCGIEVPPDFSTTQIDLSDTSSRAHPHITGIVPSQTSSLLLLVLPASSCEHATARCTVATRQGCR